MRDSHEPSHPPSDPHSIARASAGLAVRDDRPPRLPLVAALVLGLVLVAAGLYLWRRPRTPSDAAASEEPSASAAASASGEAQAASLLDASSLSPVALSEARVLGCHDPGPKVTPADQCDHVAPIEKALTDAIEQAATCVPPSTSGATIEYVADVSFLRRKVHLKVPLSGRSVHDLKVVRSCATSVRSALQSLPLEGVDHQHARYQISVMATYKVASKG
jgi:hypothetical protein